MRIFINYVDKKLFLGRLNKFIVSGRAEIKTQVGWLQRTCSESLYGTFPNTMLCCIEGNTCRLKVKCDETFRLSWLSTDWDMIVTITLQKKSDNIGGITAIDSDELRSERVCQWSQLVTSKRAQNHQKQHSPRGRKNDRKESLNINETFSGGTRQSKVGYFHLLRAPIHFPYGPGSSQTFEWFFR